MNERARFVLELEEEQDSMAELCRQYGISRQTGYKWWTRFQTAGIEGLKDESRAPHQHPNAITDHRRRAIIAMRVSHPHWGPRKIVARLEQDHPGEVWPSCSTVGEILDRAKLIVHRESRRRCPPMSQPFAMTDGPNATWCCDFKGWFKTGDGHRCDPFMWHVPTDGMFAGLWKRRFGSMDCRVRFVQTTAALSRASASPD